MKLIFHPIIVKVYFTLITMNILNILDLLNMKRISEN